MSQMFYLSSEQRELLQQEISKLLKENMRLSQEFQQQQKMVAAAREELFLELLDVADALEFLLAYTDNRSGTDNAPERLSKYIATIGKKLLGILARREIQPLDVSCGTQPDFRYCRVLEREVRPDLEEQTIVKVVKPGFSLADRVLRHAEVIVPPKGN